MSVKDKSSHCNCFSVPRCASLLGNAEPPQVQLPELGPAAGLFQAGVGHLRLPQVECLQSAEGLEMHEARLGDSRPLQIQHFDLGQQSEVAQARVGEQRVVAQGHVHGPRCGARCRGGSQVGCRARGGVVGRHLFGHGAAQSADGIHVTCRLWCLR